MKLNILAFGLASDAIGQRRLSLEVDAAFNTDQLRNLLEERYPTLNGLLKYALAVNQSYITEVTELNEEDEVAIIPPVSGG